MPSFFASPRSCSFVFSAPRLTADPLLFAFAAAPFELRADDFLPAREVAVFVDDARVPLKRFAFERRSDEPRRPLPVSPLSLSPTSRFATASAAGTATPT